MTIDPKWQDFVNEAVDSGRYSSADEVMTEGLRLLSAYEGQLAALRKKIEAAIAEGGDNSADDVRAAVRKRLAARRAAAA